MWFPLSTLLPVIKSHWVQVSILSTANTRHYEWVIKLPHHTDFLEDLLFDRATYGICLIMMERNSTTFCHISNTNCCSVLIRLKTDVVCCFIMVDIRLHFCYLWPDVHDSCEKLQFDTKLHDCLVSLSSVYISLKNSDRMFCFTVTISIIQILSFYLPSIFLQFINIIVLYGKLQMGENYKSALYQIYILQNFI